MTAAAACPERSRRGRPSEQSERPQAKPVQDSHRPQSTILGTRYSVLATRYSQLATRYPHPLQRRTPHVTRKSYNSPLLCRKFCGGSLASFVGSHRHWDFLRLIRRRRMAGRLSFFQRFHRRSPNASLLRRDSRTTSSRQRVHPRYDQARFHPRPRHGNIHRQARRSHSNYCSPISRPHFLLNLL